MCICWCQDCLLELSRYEVSQHQHDKLHEKLQQLSSEYYNEDCKMNDIVEARRRQAFDMKMEMDKVGEYGCQQYVCLKPFSDAFKTVTFINNAHSLCISISMFRKTFICSNFVPTIIKWDSSRVTNLIGALVCSRASIC